MPAFFEDLPCTRGYSKSFQCLNFFKSYNTLMTWLLSSHHVIDKKTGHREDKQIAQGHTGMLWS